MTVFLERPDFGLGPEVRKSGKVRKSEIGKSGSGSDSQDSEIGKSENEIEQNLIASKKNESTRDHEQSEAIKKNSTLPHLLKTNDRANFNFSFFVICHNNRKTNQCTFCTNKN